MSLANEIWPSNEPCRSPWNLIVIILILTGYFKLGLLYFYLGTGRNLGPDPLNSRFLFRSFVFGEKKKIKVFCFLSTNK